MSVEIRKEVESLKTEVQELRGDIKELVAAWNTAKGMTTFVKWVGSLAAGATIIYNFLIHGWPTR